MQNENEVQYSIKELRIRKNETQKDTADAVGISVQTYCAWEKDISNVGVSKVNALAHHFVNFLCKVTLNNHGFEINGKKCVKP